MRWRPELGPMYGQKLWTSGVKRALTPTTTQRIDRPRFSLGPRVRRCLRSFSRATARQRLSPIGRRNNGRPSVQPGVEWLLGVLSASLCVIRLPVLSRAAPRRTYAKDSAQEHDRQVFLAAFG